MGLVRGYAFLKGLHRKMGVPFYLSTIMEDNPARAMLTSGRAGLPTYHEIGRYRTLAIPLPRRRAPRLSAGLRIVDGQAVGAEELAAFLNRAGRSRQFYPRYTAEELASPTGILRGLGLSHIMVAVSGNRIVGTLGCWDQLPFRQHIVTGYAGRLGWARPLVNALTRVRGCTLLPRPGQPVRSLAAACLAVEGDDPAVFRALLGMALARRAGDMHDVLIIGLAANDPLLPVAAGPWHVALSSRIYAVEWGDGAGAVQTLDERPAYLEVGSL